MKKLAVILIFTILFLCSCGVTPDETEEVTDDAVTANTEILFSATEFESVYDTDLRATWFCVPGTDSGLFLRILAYDSGAVSLRVLCTDADQISYSDKTYKIKDGDESVNGELLTVLRGIADGGACSVGNRDITDKERSAIKLSLDLYDAAYGKPYGHETKSEASDEPDSENGYNVFENEKFEIKYPDQFSKTYENGILTLSTGIDKPRTVSIKHVDTVFSSAISEPESVKKNVSSQGGVLASDIIKTNIGGRTAYMYTYGKNNMYITLYYIDADSGTYIITAGSYDKNDTVNDTVISTFKQK